jgi:hypothetical protein
MARVMQLAKMAKRKNQSKICHLMRRMNGFLSHESFFRKIRDLWARSWELTS